MVTPARLNPLPVFTGARDGFSALAWLVAVNRYFNLAKISETERTPHALSYLGTPGPARWFDGCGLPDTCNFETEFTPAFKLEYIPNNFAGSCRRHLTNLRMTTNFSTYLSTFKELLGALLGYASTDAAKTTVNEFAQTSFIDNCPLVLQQMIEGHIIQNPNITLIQIFQYAQEIDRIYSFKPDTGPKTNSLAIASAPIISSFTSSSALSQATPMEIDNIQIALNNITQRFNRLERNMAHNNNYNRNNNNNNGPRNNNNNGNPPSLTPQEREWCKNNNACRRCRQPGHYAKECPIYGDNNNTNRGNNNNRQGRWVYQVAVGDSPESGKASDDQA
ncbi:hypothetical protein KI688_008859 [Linnemannia hyalina]|uniref:CCHC-type domain-containing protein n=1 Tax=Linnemannia hyalina TaxID=64524 RepID=A0A9P7XGQ8_9FUNG|nr:hypothetical protein KI688_008859 [Linnemannia hyalina]